LYLACIVILPDVLLKASRKKQRFYILLAFVAGMGLLYIVAHLEAQDDHHHHHSHQTESIEHHHHHENSEL